LDKPKIWGAVWPGSLTGWEAPILQNEFLLLNEILELVSDKRDCQDSTSTNGKGNLKDIDRLLWMSNLGRSSGSLVRTVATKSERSFENSEGIGYRMKRILTIKLTKIMNNIPQIPLSQSCKRGSQD
jgi:hypothetical protein